MGTEKHTEHVVHKGPPGGSIFLLLCGILGDPQIYGT